MSINQLHILSHDLSNSWSAIDWAVHILNEKRLSTGEYQVYEAMLHRNITAMQSILPSLFAFLRPSKKPTDLEKLLTTLVDLLNQLQIEKSIQLITQLESQINQLKRLINDSLK